MTSLDGEVNEPGRETCRAFSFGSLQPYQEVERFARTGTHTVGTVIEDVFEVVLSAFEPNRSAIALLLVLSGFAMS